MRLSEANTLSIFSDCGESCLWLWTVASAACRRGFGETRVSLTVPSNKGTILCCLGRKFTSSLSDWSIVDFHPHLRYPAMHHRPRVVTPDSCTKTIALLNHNY